MATRSFFSAKALRFFGLAALVVLIDQTCKILALEFLKPGQIKPILGDLLGLTLARNDSAAFSLGFGATWIFAISSSVAALVLIAVRNKLQTKTWLTLGGVLLGGIVGNLIDRFAQTPYFGSGHVIDFFVIPFQFPIFNIADIAITGTITFSMIMYLRGYPLGKPKPKDSDEQIKDSTSSRAIDD